MFLKYVYIKIYVRVNIVTVVKKNYSITIPRNKRDTTLQR